MPQLEQTEFFISQLFWLVITFTFLFIFLWRISLPRISKVLENRENKISNDLKLAKKMQAEAQEIQEKINNQLTKAKLEASDLIKEVTINLQNETSKKLEEIDEKLNLTIEENAKTIEQNKMESMSKIHNQIYEITKLMLSKISNINVSDDDIKKTVDNIQKKVIN